MGKGKILSVDDELQWRVLMSTVFQTAGFEIKTARNGREGMKLAREINPDLVILDLMMPGEGGVPMYRQIRTDDRLRKIPVIILSGVNHQAFIHALKMMNLGLDEPLPEPEAFIEKPPDPQDLLALAVKLLGDATTGTDQSA